MAKKKSREELEAEIKYLRKSKVADSIASVINSAIKWGGLVVISYISFRAIAVLAGKTTSANFAVSILTDILSSEFLTKLSNLIIFLSMLSGICGIIYGIWQRKLRRDTIERLQKRNQELEHKLDSNRSTSMLSPRGETRKEDL